MAPTLPNYFNKVHNGLCTTNGAVCIPSAQSMTSNEVEKIEALFFEAFEQYSDELFRFCSFKISDRERAQELVQRAFEKMWESLRKGKEIVQMRAYLYKILKFLVIDEYRKKKTNSLEVLMEKGYEPSVESPVETVQAHIEFEKLKEYIEKLPQKYQEVLVLCYINDLSVQEVAEMLKLKPNNVSVRLNRAIKKLQTLVPSTHYE